MTPYDEEGTFYEDMEGADYPVNPFGEFCEDGCEEE